ncbi:hypothetical protein [Kitasatospora sp. NBC_01302]
MEDDVGPFSLESTAVAWLTREEAAERMGVLYAVRVLDALQGWGVVH